MGKFAQMKARLSKKALRKLLKPKKAEIIAQGYKDVNEFVDELCKVPIGELEAKRKELDKQKKMEARQTKKHD